MIAEKNEFELEILMHKEILSFRKAYYNPEDSEEFWQSVIDGAEKLHRKYNNRYLDQLILVCVDDIDERSRANKMLPEHTKEQLLKRLMDRLLKEGV